MKRFCGVDLASLEANPSGITFLSVDKNGGKPKVSLCREVYSDEEIKGLLSDNDVLITAIDAPFSTGATGYRKCEEELTKLGLKLFPPSFLLQLVKRVKRLLPLIKEECIEVHPRSSKIMLGLDAKDTKVFNKQIKILVEDVPDDLTVHQCDSLIAAYTAYLYESGRTRAYGDEEGQIVLPNPSVIKLAVFDMDGTLTKPLSSWAHIHERLGTWEEMGKKNLADFFDKKITYQQFADADALSWKGIELKTIYELMEEVDYIDGMPELVKFLKENGIEIAILSGGLSALADRVANELGVTHTFANDLNHKNGCLDGTVKVKIDYNGKSKVYKKLLKKLGVKPYEVVSFGDTDGDIDLFTHSGYSIAVNPHTEKVAGFANKSVNNGLEALELVKKLLNNKISAA